MKTVSKQKENENQVIESLMRQLFELQMKFESVKNQNHGYQLEVECAIETLDDLFKKLFDS